MRPLPLVALPFALTIASSALGAAWESGMVEDEGGSVMMAWVYGEGGDVPPELRMWCGEQITLRYGQGTSLGENVEPIREPVGFIFDFGDDSAALDMQYQEMDGMYVGRVPANSRLLGLLRSEASVAVDMPSGPWPVQEFTLVGSSRAIAAVLETCR